MCRRHRFPTFRLIACAVLLTSAVRAEEPGFRPLFNGKDLTGWRKGGNDLAGETATDDGRFTVKDGAIVVVGSKDVPPKMTEIDTAETVDGDFTLRLEFRAARNANSGLHLRDKVFAHQLQVRDYPRVGPYKTLKHYKDEDWNELEVVVSGNKARCVCNGELLEAALAIPEKGPLAIQSETGVIEYRNIRVASTAAPSPHARVDGPPPIDADGYRRVWADEFNDDGPLDEKDWSFERGFVRNHELQWYQPENAVRRRGFLVIEARRENKSNPRYEAGSRDWKRAREHAEYTSACVTTRKKHAWKYGRFEIRARIDIRPGLWPAFWTLGTTGAWPGNGEIDVMEYYRGDLLANVAWGSDKAFVAKWHTVKKPIAEFNDPDWSKAFHVWRMDWDERKIRLYVDGELLNETPLTDTINGDPARRNPFNHEHYLLLNLAVGGDQGGDPARTEFPSKFEVDYVRVFQRP